MEEAEILLRNAMEHHGAAVYRLALSLTGSAADAEDVTQTVFLKLMEKQPELVPGKERAWLLQVTANECRSLYRRLCRRSTVSLDEALAVAAPEYTPLLAHVMKQRPTDRAVLYLFYYEGFSTEEIGQMLHTSQSAVTTRLHRARKNLKATLEQEGYYETGL